MTADVLVPTSADEAASLYGTGDGLTVVAATLVRSAELRLDGLWQERDWRLGHERDAGDRGG